MDGQTSPVLCCFGRAEFWRRRCLDARPGSVKQRKCGGRSNVRIESAVLTEWRQEKPVPVVLGCVFWSEGDQCVRRSAFFDKMEFGQQFGGCDVLWPRILESYLGYINRIRYPCCIIGLENLV